MRWEDCRVHVAASSKCVLACMLGLALANGSAIAASGNNPLSRISDSKPALTPVTDTIWPAMTTLGDKVTEPSLVISDLAFAGILQPGGFERRLWTSFDHVALRANTQQKPIPGSFVVVLDPGHGGSDPGSIGPNELQEKHLTLDIARRASLFLSEIDNIHVILTRGTDRGLSRQQRVAAVQRSNADLMVSLHLNQLPQQELTLVESFYAGPANIAESRALQLTRHAQNPLVQTNSTQMTSPGKNLDFTKKSARLANIMQKRVFDEVSQGNSTASNAGVKEETLYVLTRSFTPGVLIELTCLSNGEEALRLTTEDYRNRLAAAIADGIRSYLDTLDNEDVKV